MLTATFDTPFTTGGSSSQVPSLYDCALNGRPYMLDLNSNAFMHETVPLIRNQADQSSSPSEETINPEDLWRRSQDTWHDGAGQAYVDRADSDPARYFTSKGVDPWSKWHLSLLNDTTKIAAITGPNPILLTAGDFLYVIDDTSVRFTNSVSSASSVPVWVGSGEHGSATYTVGDVVRPTVDNGFLYECTTAGTAGVTEPTWPTTPSNTVADGAVVWTCLAGSTAVTFTTVSGLAGGIQAATTDGYTVYIATSTGLFTTARGDPTATTPGSNQNFTLLRYVKGRLMAAGTTTTSPTYSIFDAGTSATALMTHGNPDFTWVDFAEGQLVIYAAGYSGDKSIIYRISVTPDGSALSAPIVAAELPDGEIVRSLDGYLGFLMIGSDKGVRFATAESSGNLTLGSLIPSDNPVLCFEPQDRFCWYGLTNYDSTSTGLGRLDLSALTAANTPAYASDLMTTGQGAVTSIVTFQESRVFAVAGLGVYQETSSALPSGTLETGEITYRLPDDKVAMFVDVRSTGTVTVELSADGGPYTTIGTGTSVPIGAVRAERFGLRITLTSDVGVSAELLSWTLRAYPTATTVRVITVPLLLHETLDLHNGDKGKCDPVVELAAVDAIRSSHNVVTWQEGASAYDVIVDDYQWRPYSLMSQDSGFKGWQGTLVVKLKEMN